MLSPAETTFYSDTTLNTYYHETIDNAEGTGMIDSRGEVTTLCRAAIDSLTATIEKVQVQDVLVQLREATHATQTIRDLCAALDLPSSSDSVSATASKSPAVKVETVVVCDTQPVVAEGVRTLLNGCPDLRLQETVGSLDELTKLLQRYAPSVVMVDRSFGMQPILNLLTTLAPDRAPCAKIVVWGSLTTPAESFRLLNAGASAILCKTEAVPKIVDCLRKVVEGSVWVDQTAYGHSSPPRSRLSAREKQIVELVKSGFKNKDIAQELGIREGTVKIHLRNVFEKTGLRSRHALAIANLVSGLSGPE